VINGNLNFTCVLQNRVESAILNEWMGGLRELTQSNNGALAQNDLL